MNLKGECKVMKVRVHITDKSGRRTRKGTKSVTFTVEDTSVEELERVFKKAVRGAV